MHVFRSQIHLLLLTLAVAGCSDDGLEMIPIRGEVLYKSQPLTKGEGTVVYLPMEPGKTRQATGAIQPDGSFVMTTREPGDGVMRGEYAIIVLAYKPHPGEPQTREEHEAMAQAGGIKREHYIPMKYVDPATSGLSDTVDENHSGFKRIELSD